MTAIRQAGDKRQAGDLWGLVCIHTDTGETKRVQIGGWESSTFNYAKQAQKYADGYNKIAAEHNHPQRYEIRFAGNLNQDPWAHFWV